MMRFQRAGQFLALAAAAALFAAGPAMAADDRDHGGRDHASGETGCGWTVNASRLTFCGPSQQSTCITYTLDGEGAPDHFGVYVPADAKVVGSPVGSRLIDLCVNGDSAMRAQPNCHEKLLLFNNAHSKSFQLKFDGHRGKAETTVIVKKGDARCARPIDGIGALLPPSPDQTQTACVNYCNNPNPHQQKKDTEIFRFKGCQMTFRYADDGSVSDFQVCTLNADGNCTETPQLSSNAFQAPATCRADSDTIDHLDLLGNIIGENNTKGAFGDGWLNTGDNSCATRLVGGNYYTVCY